MELRKKTKQQAANQKHLSRDRIVNALDFTGTIHHQCQLIHEILTQGDKASIGAALGLFPNPNLQVEVGTRIVENAKELLASPSCNKRTTNDAIAFRKNAYFIMSATAPLDDASDVVKRAYRTECDEMAKLFELSKYNKARLEEMGIERRAFFLDTSTDPQLMRE